MCTGLPSHHKLASTSMHIRNIGIRKVFSSCLHPCMDVCVLHEQVHKPTHSPRASQHLSKCVSGARDEHRTALLELMKRLAKQVPFGPP